MATKDGRGGKVSGGMTVSEAGRKVFKLSANETPFGPSPHAIEVYKAAAAHLEDGTEGDR